jgi:putative phosphoesterase
MRVAVISDVHGNLPALDAVLAAVEAAGVDAIVVGGDVAGGPLPRETTERLMALGGRARFVRGNGDREMVAAFDGEPLDPALPEFVREITAWSAAQLERRHRDFLAGFHERLVLDVDGLGDVMFCHATPHNDLDLFTAASPDDRVRALLHGVEQPVVVCGHTHMQFDRRVDGIRVVNAGSVGMPYGDPGAYWAVLGPDVELRRTDYDLEAAASRVRASGYPMADDFADTNVLRPATAAEATAVFERMASEGA